MACTFQQIGAVSTLNLNQILVRVEAYGLNTGQVTSLLKVLLFSSLFPFAFWDSDFKEATTE
jgi:hypothetical protein